MQLNSYSKCVLKIFLPNLIMFSFSVPPNVVVQWAPINLVPCLEMPFHGSGCYSMDCHIGCLVSFPDHSMWNLCCKKVALGSCLSVSFHHCSVIICCHRGRLMSTRDSTLTGNLSVSLSLSHYDSNWHIFRSETGYSDRKAQSAFLQGAKLRFIRYLVCFSLSESTKWSKRRGQFKG
jgi:hypothetical protein